MSNLNGSMGRLGIDVESLIPSAIRKKIEAACEAECKKRVTPIIVWSVLGALAVGGAAGAIAARRMERRRAALGMEEWA